MITIRHHAAWLLAAVVVSACSAPAASPPAQPAAVATAGPATDSGRVTIGAVPTLAATSGSTAPPSLTPEQRATYNAARLALVEGNFAQAAVSWRSLVGVAAAAVEARYELALALSQMGQGTDAIHLLESVGPPDPRDPFVRGLAEASVGDHATAMRHLAEAATANPIVAPAIWLEVAERELTTRRAREAASAASKGLDGAQSRGLKQHLLDVRARALASAGDIEGAFEAHRQILTLATSRATLGEDLFRLARASRDLGKRDAAVQALKTALDQFPAASTTTDALRLLDELGAAAEIDPFILGRARYFAVDFRNAVLSLDASLNNDPRGPDEPSAKLYRALASLTPGNETNALRELDAIATDPETDTDIAAQALLEAGQALEGLALPGDAEARYARVVTFFPGLDAAATAAFRLGLARFARGEDGQALSAWDTLLTRRDNLAPDDLSRGLYWRGKALARSGRTADADEAWHAAAAVQPASFYSLLAAARIGQLDGPGSDTAITGEDENAFRQWLVERHQDPAAAATTVANDPALGRADAAAHLGLFRQGNWEADELIQRYVDRTDRLYVLARRFGELGLTGGATRLGQAAYTAAAIRTPRDAPAALRKVAYPRPFAPLIASSAEHDAVDPLLVEATLREASAFDPWAEQVTTGAHGLALMRPVHVDEVAHARRSTASALGYPGVAIDQQVWLLADRLRRYDGRPEAALAALATTDRLVDSWLVRPAAQDADVFVESIDYEGIRAGVRAILAARLSYGVTYGGLPAAVQRVKPEPTAAWIKIGRLNGPAVEDVPLSPALDAASARGTTAQRDGDVDTAIAVFRPLTTSADANVAAEANLRLAQALLAAGRPAEALPALRTALDRFARQQPQALAALFLRGQAEALLGHCEQAVSAFGELAAASPPPIVAQAQAASAECLHTLGRSSEAINALQTAAAAPDLPRLQTLALREQLALARVRSGDLDGARADYVSLLNSARSATYRAELNYNLGVVTGDPAYWRSAVELDPKGRGAQASLDELVAIGDPAAVSFAAATTRFEQNRYREALTAYSATLATNPSPARAAQATYSRAVSLVRLGQDRVGVGALEHMEDSFPNTPEAADGLFRAGRVRESLADLSGAAAAYRRLISMPSAGARTTDARFRLAFVQFQQGDLRSAIDGWRDLIGHVSTTQEQAQAAFWLGKGLRAAGDDGGAQQAWIAGQAADPHGFYGLRSGDLLAGRNDPRQDVERSLASLAARPPDPPGSVQEWVSARGDLAAAQARLDEDTGLARAALFLAMGLRQAAIWEVNAVENRLSDDPGAVALLGGWEQQQGLYNAALRLSYDLAPLAHVSLTSGPPAVRRLAYPLPHPDVLAQTSQKLRVDPFLFAGLMRQESTMDETAESASQARGLSQLIASTAYDAARALGIDDFVSTDLFKPRTNMTLGAFTLGQRLNRYEQRIFPSLAAYNAAQFAVDGWLLAAGTADVDTFAEAIPFTETYPYVQHIYENYRQYADLYGLQTGQ